MNYKLALIGYPLGHSLSPVLYKAAFDNLGLDGSYEILPTRSEDLVSRIKYLRANKYYGFNVTIPHKIAVSLFLSRYDEYVNLVGATNTVKIEEDSNLTGYNTDVYGFMEPLKDKGLKGKKAAVFGTGGASRAVVAGLHFLGIKKIDIYTRNIVNAKDTMEIFRNKFPQIEFQAIQNSLLGSLEDVDILVNTTPLGMKNFEENTSPVQDDSIDSLPKDAIIYDIVYNPIKTPLILKAIKLNKNYISGLDMLIYQAQKACNIWIGKTPDFNALKVKALEEYL